MKLTNGMNISGTSPSEVEYHRNENGLYTVDIKDCLLSTPDGRTAKGYVRLFNVKLQIEDESGVELLTENDFFVDSTGNKNQLTIFEIMIPDENLKEE